MAIARVQFKNAGADAASSVAAAFTSNVTAGNFLIAIISCYYGDSDAFSGLTVSDSLGNTYTQAVKIDDSTTDAQALLAQRMYYAQSPSGGANTVTFSGITSGFGYVVMTILEYSGIATSTPADVTSAFRYFYGEHGFVNTSTYTSNSATTTNADDLLVGAVTAQQTADIYTPDAGWTELTTSAAGFNSQNVAERIVAATGSYAHSGALSSSVNAVSASLASFKAAGGGGGGGGVFPDHYYRQMRG